MWVQLLVSKVIEVHGKAIRYRPGDWVDVGRQFAAGMIAANEAHMPDGKKLISLMPHSAGAVLPEKASDELVNKLKGLGLKISQIAKDEKPIIQYQHTLITLSGALSRIDLVPAGFHIIGKWQIAAPLWSYEQLALHIGAVQEEIVHTQRLIHDMRVPVYNHNLIFVRRCPETIELFKMWEEERERFYPSGDERLAFLRAIYRVKPLLCALPVAWSKPRA